MHILLSEIFPPTHGGSGRWFWEVAKRLDPVTFSVITHQHPDSKAFDAKHNMDVHRTNLSSPEWGIRSIVGLKFYWRTLQTVRRIYNKKGASALHCGRCIPEGFIGYLMHLFYSAPYLCFIHGEDIETARQSRELSWIVRLVVKRAKLLICNSKNTANLLQNHWGANPEKIHVIHPGVDTTYFKPAPRSEAARQTLEWGERPVLLTVGRLQRRKGHDKVIEALPQILKAHPTLLYCILGDGEERPRLQALAKKYGVETAVQFKVNASDETLLLAYQQCDYFILPNRTEGGDIEGFGMVLVEAQACGKPVIAGDSGGTKEALLPGKTGWVIDCTKAENIAELIIERFAKQDDTATAIMAQKWVTENLSWPAVVALQQSVTKEYL